MSETRKLKDWPIEILDGDRSKRYPKRNEMVASGVLFLSTPSIVDGRINVETSNFITEEKFSEIKKGRLVENDIVMTTRGTIGKLAFFKPTTKHKTGLINAQMLILRADKEVISPRFLFYLMGSDKYQREMKNFSSGSAQPQIPITDLKETVLTIPEINDQKAVVDVIDAYSNLIENNNRRIAILEDMAQSLYREWFVKFRFPGHESVKLKDSPLGQIPEGWEVKAATDVIEFAPKMSLPKDGEKPFVAMPSVSTSSMIIGDIEMRAGNSGTKFVNGDTLMARITPCLQNGKIGFVQFLDEANPIGFGSTEFIVMRSKHLTPEFVYCLARSDSFRGNAINSMAGADGRQRVKNDCFNSYYMAVPPNDILDKFSALAKPVFKEVFVLNQKNKNLKKQRDMLLPKLISGSITV